MNLPRVDIAITKGKPAGPHMQRSSYIPHRADADLPAVAVLKLVYGTVAAQSCVCDVADAQTSFSHDARQPASDVGTESK